MWAVVGVCEVSMIHKVEILILFLTPFVHFSRTSQYTIHCQVFRWQSFKVSEVIYLVCTRRAFDKSLNISLCSRLGCVYTCYVHFLSSLTSNMERLATLLYSAMMLTLRLCLIAFFLADTLCTVLVELLQNITKVLRL